jgi:hypothetical protein
MTIEFEIINPLNYKGWDDLVLSKRGYSIFHSSAWAKVLHESYGYKPLYFTLINSGKMDALIPFMEVKNMFTSKKGVSLPFSDYCVPIIPERNGFGGIFTVLIEYGKKLGWKSIEIRNGNIFAQDLPPAAYYYQHTLDLSINNDEQIFSNFRGSTKRNIKKAGREGANVTICDSLNSINEFYQLNCQTRKEHGLPPQPYYFFKKIYEHIISKRLGFVVLASYNNKVIAGAVYFHFGTNALYKYGASMKEYQNLRANNLVMWKTIKWYSQNGYKSFSFGRTEPENHGLLQFKEGWGAKEEIIKYYKYDLRKGEFVKDSSRVTSVYNKIFHRTPITLLKFAGSFLYKYMG